MDLYSPCSLFDQHLPLPKESSIVLVLAREHSVGEQPAGEHRASIAPRPSTAAPALVCRDALLWQSKDTAAPSNLYRERLLFNKT